MEGEQLKIIVTYKENKGSIGVSKPECDPVLELVAGDLEEVVSRILGIVEQARAKWEEAPKYPKCETDLAPAAPVKTGAQQSAPKVKGAKEEAQRPKLF